MEWVISLLQNTDTVTLVAGAILTAMGVQNRDKILKIITGLLPKPTPDDGSGPAPIPDEPISERLADEINLLKAKALIVSYGDKYQHQKCAADVREAIAHMLTDTVDAPTPDLTHA